MILLVPTLDKLQVVTDRDAEIHVHVTYMEFDPTLPVSEQVLPDRKNTIILAAGITDVLTCTVANKRRNVKGLTICNVDRSYSVGILVQHTDGTTTVIHFPYLLRPRSSLMWHEGNTNLMTEESE